MVQTDGYEQLAVSLPARDTGLLQLELIEEDADSRPSGPDDYRRTSIVIDKQPVTVLPPAATAASGIRCGPTVRRNCLRGGSACYSPST